MHNAMIDNDLAEFLPLPTKSFHILIAIADGELNGYQIMTRVEENSNGLVRIGPGTLYETLHRLAEKGLIDEVDSSEDEQTNGRGQRFYEISERGNEVLGAEVLRLAGDLKIARRVGGSRS